MLLFQLCLKKMEIQYDNCSVRWTAKITGAYGTDKKVEEQSCLSFLMFVSLVWHRHYNQRVKDLSATRLEHESANLSGTRFLPTVEHELAETSIQAQVDSQKGKLGNPMSKLFC